MKTARSSCPVDREAGARRERHVGVEGLGEGRDRRTGAVERADDEAALGAVAADHRQVVLRVMGEGGDRLLVVLRQRHPGLEAADRLHGAARPLRGPLGMGDAAAGGHPVHVARPDLLQAADAVAMDDRAVGQVGHRREPDMRVRADVELLRDELLARPERVEEDERPDHLPFRRRQHAPDGEAADVAGARQDLHLDEVGGAGIAEGGVGRGQRAHGAGSCFAAR